MTTVEAPQDLDIRGPVLVIVAHADDAEARTGGLVAALTRQECEVVYAVCTDGSKGSVDNHTDSRRLASQRKDEQLAAADRLGVQQVHFLDYPDGELVNDLDVRRRLVRLMREQKPTVVVTHDPWAFFQLHPDHRAAGFAACDAAMASAGPLYFPQMAAEGLSSHRVGQLWLMATIEPNVFVNTTATIEHKLDALACHQSQGWDCDEMRQRVRNRDQAAGHMVGVDYAEPYRRLGLPART